jgi:6,7-dimethyl-8-ribityllumazine synthase
MPGRESRRATLRAATPRRPASAAGASRAPIRAARVAIVVSRYNASITDALLAGARDEHARRCPSGTLLVVDAPGAFELPVLAAAAAASPAVDAVVALGCIVRGQTPHDRYLAHAVAHGLTRVALDARLPVAFGVLTVGTPAQARARAGGRLGNKGQEAMAAALDTLESLAALASPKPTTRPPLRKPDKAART